MERTVLLYGPFNHLTAGSPRSLGEDVAVSVFACFCDGRGLAGDCQLLVGYIGNYTAQMGGVDVITFTAGVGENDDVVRKMVCDKLAPFGVKLDEEKNATRSKEPRIISTPDSKITICVIPTNEELAIARKSAAIAEAGEDTYGNVFSK